MPRHRPRPSRRKSGHLPVYRGKFRRAHAERLLWRAGFGPRPGQAERLAELGLEGAVHSLTHPRSRRLSGPAPTVEGRGLAPRDAWGHDILWWLDRMVRTEAPLVERMTLVWHDWFATSRAGVDRALMLRQNALLRRHALGNFRDAAAGDHQGPGDAAVAQRDRRTTAGTPNENYARELQELFCLGAGRGYSERDVRQLARALTGWRADWRDGVGLTSFRYDRAVPRRAGASGSTAAAARFDWRDAADLVGAPRRAPELHRRASSGATSSRRRRRRRPVARCSGCTRARATTCARCSRRSCAIPRSTTGPRMVKPPVVLHRRAAARARARDRHGAWAWLTSMSAGQTLFQPPNVAGWDDTRWLDTATWRARWMVANYALEGRTLDRPDKTRYPGTAPGEPAEAVDAALASGAGPR